MFLTQIFSVTNPITSYDMHAKVIDINCPAVESLHVEKTGRPALAWMNIVKACSPLGKFPTV
jgi:hypothetical protein